MRQDPNEQNKKWDVTINTTEDTENHKIYEKSYYEQLYSNKVVNLEIWTNF